MKSIRVFMEGIVIPVSVVFHSLYICFGLFFRLFVWFMNYGVRVVICFVLNVINRVFSSRFEVFLTFL